MRPAMTRHLFLACSALLAVAACSRPSPSGDGTNVRVSSQSVTPNAVAPSSAAPATAAPAIAETSAGASAERAGKYPVGVRCSAPDAIARENRTLAPVAEWKPVTSAKQRVRLRVPEGVFTVADGADGLRLTSSQKAATLGPGGKDRPFAIRVVRLSRSIDELLADDSKSSPLGFVEDAFPKRTAASFRPAEEDAMLSGSAARATVAGKPAYVWVVGVEGYNSDYTLVELGPKDTLLVVADWNSAVMKGQPECWQRAVIGGVVDSIVVDG